jgi:AcrR family transcriptional regulator
VKDSSAAVERQVQILRAATALVREEGLQALSFERLAKRAGLSRQLVRYYFADLETLVVALCDFLACEYRQLLIAGIVKVGQVERLDFFLDFFFDLADGHPMPENLEVYDSFLAFAVGSKPLKDRLRDQYWTLGQVIVHELAIAHPSLKGPACEELSFVFVSMMHAHWSFVATLGFSRDHSRIARRAVDRLIRSYLEDAPHVPVMDRPWTRDD